MHNYLFAIIINGVILAAWFYLLIKDRDKGLQAIKIGFQTIFDMLPLILIIIGALGVFSSFIDSNQISQYLGDRSGAAGFIFISIVSSFMQIPGIIAFPIADVLRQGGASLSTVAVFASASTMSSVVTLPLEIKYLGKKLPFIRIGLTYIICVLVGILTGSILHLFT